MGIPTSPVARYLASSLALSEDAAVASWADASGNGHTLSKLGTADPTYKGSAFNGYPCVLFPGTGGTRMESATFGTPLANPATTWVFVGEWVSVAGTQIALDGSTSSAGSNQVSFYVTGGNWARYAGVVNTAPAGPTVDTPYVMAAAYDGASGYVWADGTTVDTGDAGGFDLGGVCVGARGDGGSPANVRVAEVILYSRRLVAAELADLAHYAGEAYNLPGLVDPGRVFTGWGVPL